MRQSPPFQFRDPGDLQDGDLELVLAEAYPGDPTIGFVPAYKFHMKVPDVPEPVGSIELRVGNDRHLVLYCGHVGYGVKPEFRGRRYAARACSLLLPLADAHGLEELWITCDPENIASRRTCELAGAEFVEIVDLPEEAEMYQQGERRKCRYRLVVP
jgi:predicted acetyltransferase